MDPAKVVAWSAERQIEAVQALKFMDEASRTPFRGTFLIKRELPKRGLLMPKPEEVAADAMESVFIAAEEWGATVQPGPEGCQRFETLQIAGRIPEAVIQDSGETLEDVCCGAINALAEILRVIVSGAVIAANDDSKDPEDAVVIAHRAPPGFVWNTEFDTGELQIEGRCRIGVFRKSRPDLSYLFGTPPGEMSRSLGWIVPYVPAIIGPNRLRFLDNRSPGHVEQEQLIQVAS